MHNSTPCAAPACGPWHNGRTEPQPGGLVAANLGGGRTRQSIDNLALDLFKQHVALQTQVRQRSACLEHGLSAISLCSLAFSISPSSAILWQLCRTWVQYNYRGMQEDLHHGPRGESHTLSSAAEHINFKQVDDAAFQNAGGNIPQDPRSSYPLPRYLPVQQLQNPQQCFYALPASIIAAANAHPLPGIAVRVDNRDITERYTQLNSIQLHAMSHDYEMPNCTGSYSPQQPEHDLPIAARPESQNLPLLMDPPIRMDFGSGNDTAVNLPAQAQQQIKSQNLCDGVPQLRQDAEPPLKSFCRTSQHVSSSANESPGPYPKQRNGRPHDGLAEAEQFEIKRKLEHETKALVGPCFDMPISVKPPTFREKKNRSKKKTRRHNQLVLIPKTVKQESSVEDNDADKEAKLAVAACLPAAEQ